MSTACAPQPDLRPFIVYDHVPAGCIPFTVTDDGSAPFLHPGDTVLIDAADREPAHQDMFAIRRSRGHCNIVETFQLPGRYGCGPNGEFIESFCWFTAPFNRPRTPKQWDAWSREGRAWVALDGPYATEGENAGLLQSQLIGRVVGILEVSFEEPGRASQRAPQ